MYIAGFYLLISCYLFGLLAYFHLILKVTLWIKKYPQFIRKHMRLVRAGGLPKVTVWLSGRARSLIYGFLNSKLFSFHSITKPGIWEEKERNPQEILNVVMLPVLNYLLESKGTQEVLSETLGNARSERRLTVSYSLTK